MYSLGFRVQGFGFREGVSVAQEAEVAQVAAVEVNEFQRGFWVWGLPELQKYVKS